MTFTEVLKPFGIDIFCTGKKFLVFNLVSRNIKIKYRRSFLGFFWTLLSPLAMACIYFFVFKVVLNVQLPHYLAFILCGVLPWSFFSQTVLEGMESIVGSWGLVSKVPIPVQVFPLVGSLTNLVTLGLSIPILVGASLLSEVDLSWSVVLVPVYCLMLFLIAYFASLILSVSFVYFRDLRHMAGIVMQVWFYATPVIYDESMIPEKYKWVTAINPLAEIFAGFHAVLARGTWPSQSGFMVSLGWTVAAFVMALWVQKEYCTGIVERI